MTLTGAEAQRLSQAKDLDYKAIGFRCGLEIHQQLGTGKLFSRLPSEVLEPEAIVARTTGSVARTLRATGSETGAVDAAAAAEVRRNRSFRYVAIEGLTSLVELDEEPPRPMDDDALDVTLTFAAMLGARPVDEIHVMRKTVIDGSNTSGFQRTALVATGGRLAVEGGDVGVWTIAVEEDSARPLEEKDGLATYTLDRLGIPLIEIATAPDIQDPQHAQRAAARIGSLLRATGRVKRGLGTIRQDLNVSVAVGTRVEIKGCQDLRAVPRVIEAECRRQLWFHHLAQELTARNAAVGDVQDVTGAFDGTQAKSVKDAVAKGAKVLALRLEGFAGLIKGGTKDGPRLGRELADHAKVAAGVKGIFHSDELPAYGITAEEVARVAQQLGCGARDGFALCVEQQSVAKRALHAVAERARASLKGIVPEVRNAMPDDSTRYLRPMPGSARMYPETDVPPIRIDASRWSRINGNLPPLPEQRVERLQAHGVSHDVAKQLVAEDEDPAFVELARHGDAALAARILLQHIPALAHGDRVRVHAAAVLEALAKGVFAKEAVPDLLAALDQDASLDVAGAVAKLGAGSAGAEAVDAVIARVLAERADFVKSRGMAALGPLMGPVMAELRGKADGALIAERLKLAVQRALA